MITTLQSDGIVLSHVAATALTAGDLIFKGGQAGQVVTSAATGDSVGLRVKGVIRLTKASATVFSTSVMAPVYWDSSSDLAVTTSTAPLVGVAVAGGADGDTYVDVLMNVANVGAPSTGSHVLRARVTTAEVNAGKTLLPAIAGKSYRLHDAAMIAIGGAAATATTVDILATQSASSVKLVANAVAGLTQNTLLRAGAANSAILAGGVSFVANDVNTAVTINHTGSDLATATHVDVLLTYSVE